MLNFAIFTNLRFLKNLIKSLAIVVLKNPTRKLSIMKKCLKFNFKALFIVLLSFKLVSYPDPALEEPLKALSKQVSVGLRELATAANLKFNNLSEEIAIADVDWKTSCGWHEKHLNLLSHVLVGCAKSPKNILFLRIDFVFARGGVVEVVPFDVPCCFSSGWENPPGEDVKFIDGGYFASQEKMPNLPVSLEAKIQGLSKKDPTVSLQSVLKTVRTYLQDLFMDVRSCVGFCSQKEKINLIRFRKQEKNRRQVINQQNQLKKQENLKLATAQEHRANTKDYESEDDNSFGSQNTPYVSEPKVCTDFLTHVNSLSEYVKNSIENSITNDTLDGYADTLKMVESAIIRTKSPGDLIFRVLESEQGAFTLLHDEEILKSLLENAFVLEKIKKIFADEAVVFVGIMKHVCSWYHTCLHCSFFYNLYRETRKLDSSLEKIVKECAGKQVDIKLPLHIFISSINDDAASSVQTCEDKSFYDCGRIVDKYEVQLIGNDPRSSKIFKYKLVADKGESK